MAASPRRRGGGGAAARTGAALLAGGACGTAPAWCSPAVAGGPAVAATEGPAALSSPPSCRARLWAAPAPAPCTPCWMPWLWVRRCSSCAHNSSGSCACVSAACCCACRPAAGPAWRPGTAGGGASAGPSGCPELADCTGIAAATTAAGSRPARRKISRLSYSSCAQQWQAGALSREGPPGGHDAAYAPAPSCALSRPPARLAIAPVQGAAKRLVT